MAHKRTSNWIRKSTRLAIYCRDGWACTFCGRTAESGAFLTLDHVVAHVMGGSNKATNLITACRSCNSSKKALPLDEFLLTLSDQGVDTGAISRRIKRHLARDLKPFRAIARTMISARR